MTQITIIKNDQGRLEGLDERGQRAYAKWRRLVTDLPVGQTLTFSYRFPRSPGHHRLFFAKLDDLRRWLTLGAGYFDMIPGLDGKPQAIPCSIDFDAMDEIDFAELHRAVDEFLWTARAQAVLWPHLDAEGRYRCVESLLTEFGA